MNRIMRLFFHDCPSYTPCLTVRVGVLGPLPHDAVAQRSAERLRQALQLIKQHTYEVCCNHPGLYSGSPRLRLIFAPVGETEYPIIDKALDLGFDLQVLLPCELGQYEARFCSGANSRASLKNTLKKAKELVELDGSEQVGTADREALRQVLLRHCDILFSFSSKEEELDSLVRGAGSRDLMIIRIDKDASDGADPVLYARGATPADSIVEIGISEFTQRLEATFALPPQADPDNKKLRDYLKPKHLKGLMLYRMFRDCLAYTRKKPEKPDEYPADPWGELPCPNGMIGSKTTSRLESHFKRADRLADTYGDLYRSFFLVTYGCGALAVLAAFVGIYLGQQAAFKIELGIIGVAVALAIIAHIWRLHERWIDYRFLGEGLRQMTFLAPLARVTPAFEVPAYLDQDDPSRTWFNWYFRALVREAGLISARMDESFFTAYRTVLAKAVDDQIVYHRKNAGRMKRIHTRLKVFVSIFFIAILGACVAHLFEHAERSQAQRTWLEWGFFFSLAAVVFPAVVAAIEGIIHQGDIDRIERRSEALHSRLKLLLNRLRQQEKPLRSKGLGDLAEEFSQIQILEQADWRAVFVTKPISPT